MRMKREHTGRPLLSVIVPSYNEEKNVKKLYNDLVATLKTLPSYEIVYINDGSRDNTLAEMEKIAKQDKSVRIVSLSRNFGKESATSAGMQYAQGESILMIDADGQHPPELIPEFVKKWQAGAQIVTGIRKNDEHEGFIKHYGSKLFYKLFNIIATKPAIPGTTDFRLIDRVVQQEFLRFTEHGRMTRGLLDWVGFKEDVIYFKVRPRMAGEATYSVKKLFTSAFNSFISHSLVPLYFSGYAGLLITPIAFLVGLFIIVEQLIMGDPMGLNVTGTAMLGVALLFFVGILLISQGLIALYISHIHTETKNRPLFIIDERHSTRLE